MIKTKDSYISIKDVSDYSNQMNDGDDIFNDHDKRKANKVSDWIMKM